MTTYYYDTGASGANDGTSWTDAAQTWAALPAFSAGDIVKMEKTSRETVSSGDLTIGSGLSNPGIILIRVDSGASDAYDTADATINIETTSGADDVLIQNAMQIYGVRFKSIDVIELSNDADGKRVLVDCHLITGPDDTVSIFGITEFHGCTFDSSATGNNTNPTIRAYSNCRFTDCIFGGNLSWKNTISWESEEGTTEFVGCDFSGMTRNPTNLVHITGGVGRFIDCDLPPNYGTMASTDQDATAEIIRSTDTDEYEIGRYNGDAISEASIVRAGGATNSFECTTNTYCGFGNVFFTPWIYKLATAASSTNFDIHFTYSGTQLTKEEIFPELEFMDSASAPYGTRVTGQERALLGDAVGNWGNSSEDWGTGAETYEQVMRITQTPGVANTMVRMRVGIEKTSQSDEIYIDPHMEIS